MPSERLREADPLDAFFWREDEEVPGLLELLGASSSTTDEAVERPTEWLTFGLGPETYALPIEDVREVLKAPAITDVPRAPAHVLGVIMVRGEVIAVFDPRHRLGLPAGRPNANARVLICEGEGGARGLLVDRVGGVLRLRRSEIEPRPGGVGEVAAELIRGIGRELAELVILLDPAGMLRDGPASSLAGGAP